MERKTSSIEKSILHFSCDHRTKIITLKEEKQRVKHLRATMGHRVTIIGYCKPCKEYREIL